MIEDTRTPRPPRGIGRLLYRFPILFYRLGLGNLLGKRFLLLEHIGRITGLHRYAVLEVIRHDDEESVFMVVSGFGKRSDWYQNIGKNPEVRIRVGRRWMEAVAERLAPEEAEAEILDYARRHPRVFRMLVGTFLGYRMRKNDEDLIALARMFIVVRISAKTSFEDNEVHAIRSSI
jgi:deazaflavin-dependent oxidoreductase (nitroreductase family)